MQDIRAITLDLDDTLWAVAPVIRRAEERLWSWLEAEYPNIADRFDARDLVTVREDVMRDYPHMRHDFRYLRKRVLARVADAAGYDDSLVEPAFAIFDAARNEVELFPDVVKELDRLASRYRLVAVTNGNANLEKIGIRHFFSAVVTAAETGVAKPARSIFDAAVAHAGAPRQSILHVGDHPETDIHGARQAGLRTAWMNRVALEWPAHLERPDATVSDFHELAALLQPALEGRAGGG